MSAKQKALALVLAELDETNDKIKGTVNGIVNTRQGKVAEGDAEYEELVNNIKNAIESDAEEVADKKES